MATKRVEALEVRSVLIPVQPGTQQVTVPGPLGRVFDGEWTTIAVHRLNAQNVEVLQQRSVKLVEDDGEEPA